MENIAKTPVEIVQELIAVHTTRKEAVDKLTAKSPEEDLTSKLSTAAQQSDQFIAELMSELSNYGDSVKDNVDRENDYQLRWKETLSNIDSMKPEEYGQAFEKLEDSLHQFYAVIQEPGTDLPASLQEIITNQAQGLKNKIQTSIKLPGAYDNKQTQVRFPPFYTSHFSQLSLKQTSFLL